MNIPEVHLSRKTVTRRDKSSGRAYPLSEEYMPTYQCSTESVHEIIKYLDVEHSDRYKRTPKSTYCNIYAHDFAKLMGAYVPRVWWKNSVLKSKDFSSIKYGVTVRELNANSLYNWFPQYGSQFGWEEVESISDATKLANSGVCVIMVAANKNRSRSGHIVAAVPETNSIKATLLNGSDMFPVQSQAGGTNRQYFCSYWWRKMEPIRIYAHRRSE